MYHSLYIQIHSIHLFVQSQHLSGMHSAIHQSLMKTVNNLILQMHISIISRRFGGFWRQMKAHLKGWVLDIDDVGILAVIQQEKGTQPDAQQVAHPSFGFHLPLCGVEYEPCEGALHPLRKSWQSICEKNNCRLN